MFLLKAIEGDPWFRLKFWFCSVNNIETILRVFLVRAKASYTSLVQFLKQIYLYFVISFWICRRPAYQYITEWSTPPKSLKVILQKVCAFAAGLLTERRVQQLALMIALLWTQQDASCCFRTVLAFIAFVNSEHGLSDMLSSIMRFIPMGSAKEKTQHTKKLENLKTLQCRRRT